MGANVGWSFGTNREYEAIAARLNNATPAELESFRDGVRERDLDLMDAHREAFFPGGASGMGDAAEKWLNAFRTIHDNWFGDAPQWYGNSTLTPGQIHEIMRESRARTAELLLAGAGPVRIYIACGYPTFHTIITWDGATEADARLTDDGQAWRPADPRGDIVVWVLTPFNSGYNANAMAGGYNAGEARAKLATLAAHASAALQPFQPAGGGYDPEFEDLRRGVLAQVPNGELVEITQALPIDVLPFQGTVLGARGDGNGRPGRAGLHVSFNGDLAVPPPLPRGIPANFPKPEGVDVVVGSRRGITITYAAATGTLRRHGGAARGARNIDASRAFEGLYGRMFGRLTPPQPSDGEVAALFDEFRVLAARMVVDEPDKALGVPDGDENPRIDAVYTYLGQFIDHDLTFDPASSLQRSADPEALIDFRTPRFDLDSLYGRGPDDQPYLYDGRGRLVLGANKTFAADGGYRPDLARSGQVALTGDKRNDENLIVSQLHVAFARFHNAVLDGVDRGGVRRDFDEAQRLVRWHYQWLVVNDFLRKVVGDKLVSRLYGPADKVRSDLAGRLAYFRPHGLWGAFLPVEFSAAAFRFGHSMVRPSYLINPVVPAPAGHRRIPIFAPPSRPQRAQDLASLRGFGEIPNAWAIDWRFFAHGVGDERGPAGTPQKSYRIDTQLAGPLAALDVAGVVGDRPVSLAERNLQRGLRFNLPSGQAVARFLGREPLSTEELGLEGLPRCAAATPLWYYVLREAEVRHGGTRLGRVGGSIVAEVILGLLVHDQFSYVNQDRTWRPSLGAQTGQFAIADLLNLADAWAPGD